MPPVEAFEPVCATNFSFLRGASHADELVWTAKRLGLTGLGVADRNSVAGVVRAHAAAKEAGLRLIVGARLVEALPPLPHKGEELSQLQHQAGGFETIIYPRDRTAWGRLTTVLTRGNRRSKKGDCALSWADVAEAMEGACAILMPPPVLGTAWLEHARWRIAHAPASCRLYVAAARPFDGTDRRRLAQLAALVKGTRARLIATTDALFHTPDRRLLADLLMCIREKRVLDTAGTARLANAERCLKAPDELVRIFASHPEAIASQQELFDDIDFNLDQLRYEYPDEVVAPEETPMQSLRRLTEQGARARYGDGIPPAVRAALDHEYELIEQLDYARYFLTVHDIVGFARSRQILCQGRGSAANSVVCYCLAITAVDPVKVDLLFERFLSPERREPPDIDVDFEHERREEVIQYIYEKYGRHRAGIAGTVITYRGRSALRETGKAMGLSADTIEALSKSVWGWGKGGIDVELVKKMTGLDVTAPRIAKTLELARQLHGFPRHLSQHVGGFVITRGPLEEVVPIGNAAMPDRTFVEWDKDDLDALGILKIDVLALGMLTCVARAFDLLRDAKGIDLDLATVPAEDPATYDMISNADTVGVFQIESRAQMSMLPRLRPRTFYDLVIEVAIVRPGPIQGDMVHPYLRRRQGLEQVTYPSKALEQVLGKTLGVPLFQEQAMRIAIVAAGFSPSEADRLRRAMATFRKVGIIHEFGVRLVDGMVANGYERDFAERCFRQIEGFGEYGFPESHAASFALIVYVSAWLKHHHPDVFCAAILNAQPMGFYATAQLVRDAQNHGVKVLAPDVNESDWDAGLEVASDPSSLKRSLGEVSGASLTEGVSPQASRCILAGAPLQSPVATAPPRLLPVRLGLREIKGFSEADAARVVAAREAGGPFKDAEDLKRRARLNGRAMDLLAGADAMRSINLDRRGALWQSKGLAEAALPLFAHLHEYGPEADPALPEMPLGEHVVHDYSTMRLSLKAHPLSFFRQELQRRRFVTASDLATAANGRMLDLAGLVLVRQKPGTAKGVLFVTLEDETGSANLIVWPKVFERFRRTVLGAKLLHVRGQLQREGQVIHIIARSLADMTGRLPELSGADGHDTPSFSNPWAHADEVRAPAEDPRAIADQKLGARTSRIAAAFGNGRNFH